MTTPQPAALPELLTDTDVARIFRRVYGGTQFDSTERMFAAEIESAVRERLAALQSQPAAAVSDERQLLREIVENHAESLQALGDELRQRGVTQISYYGPQAEVVAKAMQLIDRARAILALRPQAVPIGRDDLKMLMSAAGYVHATAQEKADFINGFRNAEAHHGITAQGAQGGEGRA